MLSKILIVINKIHDDLPKCTFSSVKWYFLSSCKSHVSYAIFYPAKNPLALKTFKYFPRLLGVAHSTLEKKRKHNYQ